MRLLGVNSYWFEELVSKFDMSISVITCLADSAFEDLVVESLISSELPDLSLEFRAISLANLMAHLENLPSDNRRRVLIHDLGTLDLANLTSQPALVVISLDDGGVESIRAEVARALRDFDVRERTVRRMRSDLVLVTGTSGSPGISTIALNLANELALEDEIHLIDSDPNRRDLAFLLGGKRDEKFARLKSKLSISQGELAPSARLQIADAGAAPEIRLALSDRRTTARCYSDLLETSGRIVFVLQPENNTMFELERFLAARESELFQAQLIFLINKVGQTRRQLSIQRRFTARIGTHQVSVAPLDLKALELAKSQYAPLADVAPRSKLRRSLQELARSLVE